MSSVCLPPHPAVAYLFLVRRMHHCVLRLCLIALTITPLSAAQYPEAVWKARFTYRPSPDYPAAYRVRQLTGSGIFRMHVDQQGRVTGVTIVESTGHKELDVLAMKAFVEWRGKPGPKWDLDMPITFTTNTKYRPKNPEDAKHYRGSP
jgi:TonB family protein